MKIPPLDKPIQDKINNLIEDTDGKSSSYNTYFLHHELLFYGLSSIAHYYIMDKAKEVVKGEISLNEFLNKYSLQKYEKFSIKDATIDSIYVKVNHIPQGGLEGKGFFMPLNVLETENIFIPEKRRDRLIYLFQEDYGNKMLNHHFWNRVTEMHDFLRKHWVSEDFKDPKIIKTGIKFSKSLWKTAASGIGCGSMSPASLELIFDYTKELVDYYSEILSLDFFERREIYQMQKKVINASVKEYKNLKKISRGICN
jgi:hypothetical protein